MLAAIVMALITLVVVMQAATLGFWEPWESSTVRADIVEQTELDDEQLEQLADDREGWSAEQLEEAVQSPAVPTLEGEPVEVSWLRAAWTSLVVDDQPVVETGAVGTTERRARMPLVLLAVLLLGSAMVWVRTHVSEGAAAMTAVMLATSPVVLLGALFLSGPLVAVAASALAVMGFFHAIYGEERTWLWVVVAAGALAVVALDIRLVGVVATLAVVVALAAAQALYGESPDGDTEQPPGLHPGFVTVAVVGFFALMGWGWVVSDGYEEGIYRPDIAHLLWVLVPTVVLAALALAARHTTVGRALVGLKGLVFTAGGVIPLVVLGLGWAAVFPADPDVAEATRPGLEYLVVQHHPGELEAANNFSWWWRQVGFGLFPYFMLLVPAVGYLAWKLRAESETTPVQRSVALLAVVWPVAAWVVIVPAASFGHAVFPAFFPLVLAMGWMVSDGGFWKQLRVRPALYLAVAAIAVFTLMLLGDDLDEFPGRVVDFALAGEEDPGVDDDFLAGSMLETWTTVMMAAVLAYFVGILSWLAFAWGDAKRLLGWARSLPKRIKKWWKHRREDGTDGEITAGSTPDEDVEPNRKFAGQRRMAEREAWRDGEGRARAVARRIERLPGLVGLVVAAGVSFTAVLLVDVVAELDNELSSRAVVQAYLELADEDDALYRFDVEQRDDGYYVRGIDELSNRRDFERSYDDEQRHFVLIPEDELAQFHSTIRRDHAENMPVLAAGGGMYLVSNRLEEGETDISPISPYVLDEPDDDYIALEFEDNGEMKPPVFNRQIKFLGYRLDRGSADETAVYSWGDTMEITKYFEVKRRVPRAQEIFMHIDLGGNRIHGDHDPVGGLYPTNRWVAGDVIKNVHEVEIDRFVAPGTYTVYTGFYSGDDRMSVQPESAHDGEDRVDMTRIEVVPF